MNGPIESLETLAGSRYALADFGIPRAKHILTMTLFFIV
jgi:hypothetical protein